MRSDLVLAAEEKIVNTYLLCHLISKSARKMHRPGMRMAGSINDMFERCATCELQARGQVIEAGTTQFTTAAAA